MVKNELEGPRPGGQEAFRLIDDILEVSSATSVSSSKDKQRIDAMFDETRSTISRTPPGKGMRRAVGRKASSASPPSSTEANAVQVRIEKMFAEMSAAGGPVSPGNRFTVDYLGSVPIADKVTTLQGLQEPLKHLYAGYRRVVTGGGGGRAVLWEPGFVDISKEGLKVQHGRLDQLNPFPTIAVWAAVKFVCRIRSNTSSYEYAFLPLIADPDGIDRDTLFQVMSSDEQRALCPEDGAPDVGAPMFAVVMRKVGVSRQLQCHAFVCSSSEDAVIMAANLYQALMKSMRAAAAIRTMHHENGFGRVSISGSTCGDEANPPVGSSVGSSVAPTVAPPDALPGPKRPPRKKKTSQQSPPAPPSVAGVASLRGNFPASNRRASLSKSSNLPSDPPSGDILTKVAIPRSSSFLHANGPLMRYGRRGDAALPAPPTASASPLGFHELFAEFRQQEGLESLDDILGAIIDAEGMSFNDLKPIYKEFLLKLALTLTKDELYQRSKQIMHKQRKRQREARRRRGFGVAAIKRTLRRSLGRLRQRVRKTPAASAYVISRKQKQGERSRTGTRSRSQSRSVRVSHNACNVNVNVSISNKPLTSRRRSAAVRRSRSTTSEESDLLTTVRCYPDAGSKHSGYISYSDCGYDSESCTCASAERCYCNAPHPGCFCACDTDSCLGSDKCYCSRPRIRGAPNYLGGALEQLKRQGFVASESSLSRAASPSTAWRRNERRLAAACTAASAGSVRSTKSLEFVNMWPASRNTSRMDMYRTEERKALLDTDYQSRRRAGSKQHRKVLVVSARDPKGRVIYMGASCRNELEQSGSLAAARSQFFPRATLITSERRRRTSSTSTTGDVFSVKKSAEMAALFANVKMSQTTDIIARSTGATATDATATDATATDATATDATATDATATDATATDATATDATATDASASTTTYSSVDGPTFLSVRRQQTNNGSARGGFEGSLGYLP